MDEQPPDPPPDAPAESPRTRRRVVEADVETSRDGRTGCLVIGGLLGIIAGALFAFFGLPPLINHFFAEEHVAAGQTYSSGGRTIHAVGFSQTPSATIIDLEMTVNTTWDPQPKNFTVQYSSGGSWTKATGIVDAATGEQLNFDVAHLGKPTTVRVFFPPEPGRGTPRYLHLGDPHIQLELPPPGAT